MKEDTDGQAEQINEDTPEKLEDRQFAEPQVWFKCADSLIHLGHFLAILWLRC